MIIYNVTINIDQSVHEHWLEWMKNEHVQEVMRTNCFEGCTICRILHTEVETEQEYTYCFQYTCQSMVQLEHYKTHFAPALQHDVEQRYANKFVAFRTVLEILN